MSRIKLDGPGQIRERLVLFRPYPSESMPSASSFGDLDRRPAMARSIAAVAFSKSCRCLYASAFMRQPWADFGRAVISRSASDSTSSWSLQVAEGDHSGHRRKLISRIQFERPIQQFDSLPCFASIQRTQVVGLGALRGSGLDDRQVRLGLYAVEAVFLELPISGQGASSPSAMDTGPETRGWCAPA